jgi:hypothetical protein
MYDNENAYKVIIQNASAEKMEVGETIEEIITCKNFEEMEREFVRQKRKLDPNW